jgi:hypothetical protein
MENPVDNIVDLGFVNYVRHPENPKYVVFRLQDVERAVSFEKELKAKSIWYEKSQEEKRMRTYHLFGIHQSDFKTVEQINFRVEGIHKKPIIRNKILRYALLSFTGIVMTLAILGYYNSRKALIDATLKVSDQSKNLKQNSKK